MSLLENVTVRSPSRLRLQFDQDLAIGAYVVSWFSLSTAGAGVVPTFVAALIVAGLPRAIELVMDPPISAGENYTLVIAAGLPFDVGTSAGESKSFWVPSTPGDPSVTVTIQLLQADLYQEDLWHDGTDFVETVGGDLALLGGPENAKAAIVRNVLSDGLPWNPDYGGHPREYVDAPSPLLSQLRGQLVGAALRDDRLITMDAVVLESEIGEDPQIELTGKLVGDVDFQASTELR